MNSTPSAAGARETQRPTIPLPPPPRQSDDAEPVAAPTAAPAAAGSSAVSAAPAPPDPAPADPADRTWRKGYPGVFGIANVIVSGALALVWAWIPVAVFVVGVSGLIALGLGLFALFLWFALQRGVNWLERYRAEAVYGDGIASLSTPRSPYPPGFSRFMHSQWLVLRSPSFWRSTAHHFLKMVYGLFICGLTGFGLAVSGVLAASAMNPDFLRSTLSEDLGHVSQLVTILIAVIAFVSAVLVLVFSPYLDRGLDRALLPPTRTEALHREVATLDRARVGAVDAAAGERLRIERNLHDGVQPMLVATSMKLGMAKAKLATDPEAAKKLLDEAHTESKTAIQELRQLARGIHPAVLSDRGLDAAVSALAARSVVPVRVTVDLADRSRQHGSAAAGPAEAVISPEAEAVAYFVVAEALTNISKHSQASEARVTITVTDGRLHISVSDNGRGGAQVNPTLGSGLSGLVDRVTAARGTWALTSPAGGPTTLVVEVPCA